MRSAIGGRNCNENEWEPRKNTRSDDVSTQKFRSRCRCGSVILTSLLFPFSQFTRTNPTICIRQEATSITICLLNIFRKYKKNLSNKQSIILINTELIIVLLNVNLYQHLWFSICNQKTYIIWQIKVKYSMISMIVSPIELIFLSYLIMTIYMMCVCNFKAITVFIKPKKMKQNFDIRLCVRLTFSLISTKLSWSVHIAWQQWVWIILNFELNVYFKTFT